MRDANSWEFLKDNKVKSLLAHLEVYQKMTRRRKEGFANENTKIHFVVEMSANQKKTNWKGGVDFCK